MKLYKLITLLSVIYLSSCTLTNKDSSSGSSESDKETVTTESSTEDKTSEESTSESSTSTDTSEEETPYSSKRMQDTPILHCWNWSMDNIASNLENIKEAGFKTIQLSPMQPQKDFYNGDSVNNGWWKLYQPLGFSVATGNNAIGTKSELVNMCKKAKSLGIDVIVDVVSNHLAGGSKTSFNGNVNNYEPAIYSNNLYHTLNKYADDNTIQNVVQANIGDFPDLKTESDVVQNRVLSLLKEYLDCGVNGFRFDAAKHIETPDDGEYASNYWPTILNGATSYASNKGYDKPYYYGEILTTCGKGREFSSYTKYMSVIDSAQGSDVLYAVKNKSVSKIKETYNTKEPANKLVLWGESHDTYANSNGETKNVSQDIINKAYVIQTSRKDASSLYLARPNSMGDKLGNVGSTSYQNVEIKAINEFHNEFVNKSESISVDNNCFINVRGGLGAAIVNINNDSTSNVKISASGLTNGTYTDLVTNSKYTVANNEAAVNFTNGVCILVNDDKTSEVPPTLSLSASKEVFSNSLDVNVTSSDATSIIYSINNGANQVLNGSIITLPSSLSNGVINLKVTAENSFGSITKEMTFVKSSQLENKSLVVYGVDTNYTYYCWGWSGSQSGSWYEPTFDNNIVGFSLANCDHFIIVKFEKSITSPDWDKKINQTENISLDHQVYNYIELPLA